MESTIVRLKRQLSGSTAGSTLLLSVDLLSLIGEPALSTRERLLEQREMLPIFAWTLLKENGKILGKKKELLTICSTAGCRAWAWSSPVRAVSSRSQRFAAVVPSTRNSWRNGPGEAPSD